MKNGFTLAEVLITLGIIGIVASMTIPTLMTNYQKKSTAIRVKKAYAEVLQAIKLSEEENGTIETWEIDRGSVENTKNFVNRYIMPYYKGLTLCSEGSSTKCGVPMSKYGANYLTLNGTELSFRPEPDKIYILIDINNKAKPNKIGNDTFYFVTNEEYELRPYGWFNGITRENVLNGYSYFDNKVGRLQVSCKNKNNSSGDYRAGCTALLMLDNWEFKKDYPW